MQGDRGHGSRLLSVSMEGKISVLMAPEILVPVQALMSRRRFFGNYGGQGFSIAQPTTADEGRTGQPCHPRIDLSSHTAAVFCTCPILRHRRQRHCGLWCSTRGSARGRVSPIVFTRLQR